MPSRSATRRRIGAAIEGYDRGDDEFHTSTSDDTPSCTSTRAWIRNPQLSYSRRAATLSDPATTLTAVSPRSASRRVAASTTSRPMPRPAAVRVHGDGEDLGRRQVSAFGGRVPDGLEHPAPRPEQAWRGEHTRDEPVVQRERAVQLADVGRRGREADDTAIGILGHDVRERVGRPDDAPVQAFEERGPEARQEAVGDPGRVERRPAARHRPRLPAAGSRRDRRPRAQELLVHPEGDVDDGLVVEVAPRLVSAGAAHRRPARRRPRRSSRRRRRARRHRGRGPAAR